MLLRWLAILLFLLLPPQCREITVDAGPDRVVGACEEVVLEGARSGIGARLDWSVEGLPLLALEPAPRRARLGFRAPAVAVPTELVFRVEARDLFGQVASDEARVRVEPAPAAPGLPAGMAAGCAPFSRGVASGDPLPDAVMLWTRVDPEEPGDTLGLQWVVSTSPDLDPVVARGETAAGPATDHTAKVDVRGLVPDTTYYYRFRTEDGALSELGRTRTAPVGRVERLRFAVASCSSIYSGFFNAYARIAEREDLAGVIHLGDYIYDFVDQDERIRVPVPEPPRGLDDLTGWRGRHAYYLLDPDLRAARAMHPWMMLWDNHDVEQSAAPDYEGSVQAFREWNPIRNTDPGRPEIAYRHLAFGDLLDLYFLDMLLFREFPAGEAPNILGEEQFQWIEDALPRSRADWRVLANQKLFSTLRIDPNLGALIAGDPREVFDPNTWDGFPESRSRLLAVLADEGIEDNVVLSGDAHISLAFDLVDDPTREEAPYDPATGEGALGVEFMPTSISRGNFDEEVGALLGVPKEDTLPVLDSILADTVARNPHNVYAEIVQHGYGILDLSAERAVAEYWYVPILEDSDLQTPAIFLTAPRGENRWVRSSD